MMRRPKHLEVWFERERVTDDVWQAVIVEKKVAPVQKPVERVVTDGYPSTKKRVATLAMLTLMALSVFSYDIRGTLSYFSDIERSLANALGAGILDFEVLAETYEGVVGVGETEALLIDPTVTEVGGSFDIEYSVKAVKIDGDDVFCNAIHASSTGAVPLDKLLLDVNEGPATSTDAWNIGLSLLAPVSPAILDGMTCTVDLVYTGKIFDLNAVQGYTDEETVRIVMTANTGNVGEEVLLRSLLAPEALKEGDETVPPPEGGEEPKEESTEDTPAEEVPAEEKVPAETPPGPETENVEVVHEEVIVREEVVVEDMGNNSADPVLPEPTPESTHEPEPLL